MIGNGNESDRPELERWTHCLDVLHWLGIEAQMIKSVCALAVRVIDCITLLYLPSLSFFYGLA